MDCLRCQSPNTIKDGKRNGLQQYRCKDCGRRFTEGGRKRGGQCIGDRPMTPAERQRQKRKRDKLNDKTD